MFKGLFFSCLHYTGSSPLMRKDNYGELILGKLQWIIDKAKGLDATLFCCGDLFHRKHHVTIRELNKITEVIGDNIIFGILGNHDVQARNIDTQVMAIGNLIRNDKYILLDDNTLDAGNGVTVSGTSYHAHYEELEPWKFSIDRDDCETHIHLTHALITDTSLPFECVSSEVVAQSMSADILVNGHYHKYWEYPESGIYNVGSVARVAMDKNSINKVPKVLLVEIDGSKRKIKTIDIPVEKDVWVTELKRESLNSDEIDEFAKSIEEMDLSSDEDILKEILKDEDDEVEKLVYEYLGE